MQTPISGFSRLSKEEKIDWIISQYFNQKPEAKDTLTSYWNQDEKRQALHDDFIENTISNYYLPLGVAPNFNINGKLLTIPMAIEESSVVAAAKAAKYWGERGGFKTEIIGEEKIGQVHFIYTGDPAKLGSFITEITPRFLEDVSDITANMMKRGGGITGLELRDKTAEMQDYFQLHLTFHTVDSMGANL